MVADFYEKMGFQLEQKSDNGDSIWFFEIPEAYCNKNQYIEVQE